MKVRAGAGASRGTCACVDARMEVTSVPMPAHCRGRLSQGNLTIRPFSVVHSIIYDEAKGKATGVRVIDTNTHESIEYHARIIFVNASTINSNLSC